MCLNFHLWNPKLSGQTPVASTEQAYAHLGAPEPASSNVPRGLPRSTGPPSAPEGTRRLLGLNHVHLQWKVDHRPTPQGCLSGPEPVPEQTETKTTANGPANCGCVGEPKDTRLHSPGQICPPDLQNREPNKHGTVFWGFGVVCYTATGHWSTRRVEERREKTKTKKNTERAENQSVDAKTPVRCLMRDSVVFPGKRTQHLSKATGKY